MLAELTITPLGAGEDIAVAVAHVVEVVADSGLDYQVTALGTLVEGEADEVWALVRRCHELARAENDRVLTAIRIDDSDDAHHELTNDVEKVESILGRALRGSA